MVKILLVEDEAEVAAKQQQVLTRAGHQADTVDSGSEAMRCIADGAYDVILCDIGLPDMDGLAVLKHVRKTAPDIPVVFITGQPTLDTAIQAVDEHAFAYLLKPVKPPALLDTVRRAGSLSQLSRLKRQALQCAWRGEEAATVDLNDAFSSALRSLWIAFQPIVSWSERRVVAYEALVRNDESTLARPPELLKAAQRLGRTEELGQRIRAAIAQTARALPSDITLFVNLLPADLNDDELLSVTAPLSSIAERVVLEITEREPLNVVSDLDRRLRRLRILGYRIAIDDLGEGHAGLHTFVRLQPDIVKLDRCLIREIDQHAARREVVGSMIALCSRMGIKLIAEGVETQQERDVLIGLGSDWLQGYLFARPAKGFPPVCFG